MKVLKGLFALVFLGLLLHLSAQPLRADKGWTSPLTLGEPTEIPGTVLEPGKYIVKVIDIKTPRKVVQFLNEDQTKVFATVLAVPNYRVTVEPEGQFVYFQRAEGLPQALKSWFYPANNFGVEFVYPKAEAVKIAQTRHEEVYTAPTAKPEVQEPVVALTPELKEIPVKTEPLPTEEPKTLVAEKKLPRTGSDLPLLALAGFAAIGAGAALRILAVRKG